MRDLNDDDLKVIGIIVGLWAIGWILSLFMGN